LVATRSAASAGLEIGLRIVAVGRAAGYNATATADDAQRFHPALTIEIVDDDIGAAARAENAGLAENAATEFVQERPGKLIRFMRSIKIVIYAAKFDPLESSRMVQV